MQPDSMTFAGTEYRPFNRNFWVSRCGKVIRRMSQYTPKNHPQGYLLCGGRHLLHRMVATVWIRPPLQGEHIHHINHDKTDNRVENLEWVQRLVHLKDRHAEDMRKFSHSRMTQAGKEKLRQLRLGTVHSDETKRKIGLAMKQLGVKPPSNKGRKRPYREIAWMYERNPKCQPCTVLGVRYKSFTEAGTALGIRPLTLRKRCLSSNFPDYKLG